MACARCKWPYPDGYTNPMFVNGGYVEVCGICGLAITNEVHGTRETRFRGAMAELARKRAVAWRERHPNAQPSGAN